MTTDTFPKGAVARIELDGVPVTLIGFAKGSGMIAPDMATMLVFLFTDAAVPPGLLAGDGRAQPATRPSTASPSTATPRPRTRC